MIRHAVPYVAASDNCCCAIQTCGGLIPDSDCPDHGAKKEPVMAWHHADSPTCLEGQASRRERRTR
ncbi:hypothetical protein ACIG0D_27440 [Streptomyces sp. NPDC052773]|uniref:hypothetical protein n=1 Tax=Streptomyces sp. NPDC052773 TaxID=3365693 RepID=UPI0037D706E1